MKTRHVGKALVALAAMLAVVGFGGMPASANDADITAGTLQLFGADSAQLDSQNLADPSVECAGSTNSTVITHTATTHAWTIRIRTHVKDNVGGTVRIAVSDITSSGTSSSTGTSSGTSSGTISLTQAATATGTSCTTTGGTCVLGVSGMTVAATHNIGSTSAVASNTTTASGNNGDHGDFGFEVAVTGGATSCGSLIGADDGSASYTNVTVHVTT